MSTTPDDDVVKLDLVAKPRVTVTTKTETTLDLNRQNLLDMLRASFFQDVPDNATITVQIPGGGDWSNMSLDIGDEHPLTITYTVEDVSNG